MTLEKIERHLPNGFHDAVLRRLAINYVDGTATFHLSVSAGDPDAKSEPEREKYKDVEVSVTGLEWCIIEAPKEHRRLPRTGLWLDAGPLRELKTQPALPTASDAAFVWWFFIHDWNSFLYIAGHDAKLS